MRPDASFSVAALCCHSGNIYCLPQGRCRPIRLPPHRLEKLGQWLPPNVVYLVHNPSTEFKALSCKPVIDLQVETQRYWNGFSGQPPSSYLLEKGAADIELIPQHLTTMCDYFGGLVNSSHCSEAIQRGQTVLDLLTLKSQGVPINVKRLKGFQRESRKQFHSLCRDNDLSELFPLGELCSRQMRAFISEHYKENWPRDHHDAVRVDKDTLSDMARTHGGLVSKIYGLFKLSHWLKNKINVDEMGYHHIALQAFGTKTGRCKTIGSSVLGLPKLMRTSLMACDDRFLVEVDVSSQDIATAAGLSGDSNMIAMYQSEDFYLATARSAGEQINDRNKAEIRAIYKLASLAVMYGMSARSLAVRLKCSISHAEKLLQSFFNLFPRFQDWLDASVFNAYRNQRIATESGWQMRVSEATGERTLMNWQIQATGAHVMNRSLRNALERNLAVCAMNHDALYVSANSQEEAISVANGLTASIQEAAGEVLPNIQLRTSVSILNPNQASNFPNNLRELFSFF